MLLDADLQILSMGFQVQRVRAERQNFDPVSHELPLYNNLNEIK